jgi:Flp pilus assembly protein TadG
VLVYSVIALIALLMVASLAIDYGRVQLAKTQLQNTADAAARAGAAALSTNATAAEDAAIAVAAQNLCDGTPVALNRTLDIEIGWYDETTDAFTALSGTARDSGNAVRVTARRIAARNSAIPLSMSQVLGRTQCDVTSKSIAIAGGGTGGYIGLSLTRMFNTTRFDSYNSTTGMYTIGTSRNTGRLYGNDDLALHDYSYLYGRAEYGQNGTLTIEPNVTVNPGPVTRMNSSFTFPPVSLGSVPTNNDNVDITQYRSGTTFNMGSNKGTVTFPGGTYYFTSFTVGDNSTVLFSGTATIYLNGNGSILGNIAHTSYVPGQLRLQVAGSQTVKIDGDGKFYGCIYAPQANVHHHTYGQSFGSVVSSLLCFRHNAQGHFDESSGTINGNVTVKQVR